MSEPPSPSEPSLVDMLALAVEFHRAALALDSLAEKGRPLTRAPRRLAAIHAIELYLSALLMRQGMSACEIRKLGHDLGERIRLAEKRGLCLRKGTRKHLVDLSDAQEYVALRYRPSAVPATAPNRLEASLREVAGKTANLLERAHSDAAA